MKNKFFQKQKMMRKVLLSLLPIFIFAGYLYGIRLLILILVVFPAGIITEFIFEKIKKKPVSEAVLVTCSLYVLSLPPDLPWWVALIGIVFAVVMGKEVFGGFGRNPFNPAIAGRLFVYITFPNYMTGGWLATGAFGVDAVSAATPLATLRQGGALNFLDLLLGFRPGAMGESCIVLIVLAGLYLMITRTASWIIIVSALGSAALLTFIFDIAGISQGLDTIPALASGSLFFVVIFMATDPVSAPKKPLAKFLYGIIIGSVTVLIRTFSTIFSEGTSFAVMIGNTFASLLDEIAGKLKK